MCPSGRLTNHSNAAPANVLINLKRCYRLLEGVHGLHELLHGDVVPSRGRNTRASNRSFPRTPHIVGKTLNHDCQWDLVLSGPTVGAKCSRRLTQTVVSGLLSPPENRTSLIEESLTCKDKGRLDGHLHSDAQVSIRVKKHQVYKVVSVLETVYLVRVLGPLYIG